MTGDVVTLTVHHREASFVYPVTMITPEERDTAGVRDYDGSMFSRIPGPESPERYPLRVRLTARQELRQVSPTEVQVVYVDGVEAFQITAEKAHDVAGTTVPTTLEKTGEEMITLTVHHRAGNSADGGAPFAYPITAGEGWEGGPSQTVFVHGPPDDAELRAMHEREAEAAREHSPPADEPASPVHPTSCTVPSLHGLSLRAAKARLRSAHCTIGAVHLAARTKAGSGKVLKQFRAVGIELAADAPVAVKVGAGNG